MKQTDFIPRGTMLEVYLHGKDLVGAEIGVDAGAHAEALLLNCDIKMLYLIDVWINPEMYGYCRGRLETKGWKHKFQMIRKSSIDAIGDVLKHSAPPSQGHMHYTGLEILDFLYFDQLHDYESVRKDMEEWWTLLKPGGILVHRGYALSNTGIKKALDEFIAKHNLKAEWDNYHNEMIIWK